MCSVVGYIGTSHCKDILIEGLSRLEYRGYDSAGFACLSTDNNRLVYAKSPGRLSQLKELLAKCPIDGRIGIGHTRWSTHGVSTQENAHPHFDCKKTVSIVHNGIIENHHALRKELLGAKHVFVSDTDTEVVAHLFESLRAQHGTCKQALTALTGIIDGAYAFIILDNLFPDQLILARKRSPLCIGIGQGQMFVASDPIAFAGKTDKVIFLPDASCAIVKKDSIELFDFMGKPLPTEIKTIDFSWVNTAKDGHEHHMLKEIYEQRRAIHATVTALAKLGDAIWDHIGLSKEQARAITSLSFIGCGTSWHAARIAQFFFEYVAQVPTRVLLASEFRYMPFFPEHKSIYIAISQSGETADTLESLRLVQAMGMPTIALTNVASSTLVREAGGYFLTHAGQEMAVASTKAFSTQVAALYWLAHRLALEKGLITPHQMELAEQDLLLVAQVLEDSIETYKMDIVQTLAKRYAHKTKAIFLGRHISYPFAMEAALKLKEISYIFSQGYPAGELKHGPLALVDAETPIFLFSHQDPLIYQKLVANAQEVKARSGHIIAFAFEGQDELCKLADQAFVFPRVHTLLGPLAMTGVMQFFAYQIAKELNMPIDKPRNLAKSVTVE